MITFVNSLYLLKLLSVVQIKNKYYEAKILIINIISFLIGGERKDYAHGTLLRRTTSSLIVSVIGISPGSLI